MKLLLPVFAFLFPIVSFAREAVDGGASAEVLDPFFAYALGIHVVLGLIGVMALYVLWMGLLKRKIKIVFLLWTAFLSFASLIGSWIAGGTYYVGFYGGSVKPVIKSGDYAWAHLVVTETKEHIFLFLPFLAALTFIVLLLQKSEIETNDKLRSVLAKVVGAAAIIGILVTLAGIVMSGATG